MIDALSRAAGRAVLGWPAERHSLPAEAGAVLALYGAYETSRGLVAGDASTAIHHAHSIRVARAFAPRLRRACHVADATARTVPGLVGTLGVLYLDAAPRRHRLVPALAPSPEACGLPDGCGRPCLLASALALVGFLAFPTAPPRLAGARDRRHDLGRATSI